MGLFILTERTATGKQGLFYSFSEPATASISPISFISCSVAQIIGDKKIFSLLEVTQSIQKTLAERYRSAFWVKAEMNKLNLYSHSGHCYPELVEKNNGRVVAQMKSNLWKNDYERINERFLSVLKEPLRDGITILFFATITFDPSHGLALRILDIDPAYSLGELEREKAEAIERLRKENIFDNNKRLRLPLLPQRIAVISVETSKGYADYMKVLTENPWGYRFFNHLFPALLQGDRSVGSIIEQLRNIRRVVHHFDAVAIIRGGGGDVGLSSFNNYTLAREIALFPLPVITGIGHSTNETVTEMVAHRNAITPTELADFLIQKFHEFAVPVKEAERLITAEANRIISGEKTRLADIMKYFRSVTIRRIEKNHHGIDSMSGAMKQQAIFILRQQRAFALDIAARLTRSSSACLEKTGIDMAKISSALESASVHFIDLRRQALAIVEKNVGNLDPVNILKRGFTITLANGRPVKDPSQVNPGETIETILTSGRIESQVTRKRS